MTCGVVVVRVERSGWMDRYSATDLVDLGSIPVPDHEHVVFEQYNDSTTFTVVRTVAAL